MTDTPKKLLIAASGTGGHLFPAIATAEELSDYHIEWLGVPNRLETHLVPAQYPMHTVDVEGFQSRLGLSTLKIMVKLIQSVTQVRALLKQGQFQGVFTTGGYIAGPAIVAARSLNLPAILHESNALPGKVTRWLSPWCTTVALGFDAAAPYLPRARKAWVGNPVRSQFMQAAAISATQPLIVQEHLIPADAPLIVIIGGSQGAVAVNRFVRECAPAWLDAGAWIVHLTGENDPDVDQLTHQHYIAIPFYSDMASLLQRATLAISRAGSGTLTELAMTHTPSILIPYPYAAEDHQTYNAAIFAAAGAAQVCRQSELSVHQLKEKVLNLLEAPSRLHDMANAAAELATKDSAHRLATLIRQQI